MSLEEQARLIKQEAQEFAERVAPVYELLGWKWSLMGVPGEEVIEREVYLLVDAMLRSDPVETPDSTDLIIRKWGVETGGLKVLVNEYDDGGFGYRLQMIISWDYIKELKERHTA